LSKHPKLDLRKPTLNSEKIKTEYIFYLVLEFLALLKLLNFAFNALILPLFVREFVGDSLVSLRGKN
jgi:hypothetical protein